MARCILKSVSHKDNKDDICPMRVDCNVILVTIGKQDYRLSWDEMKTLTCHIQLT